MGSKIEATWFGDCTRNVGYKTGVLTRKFEWNKYGHYR